jgi:hypothetical protein
MREHSMEDLFGILPFSSVEFRIGLTYLRWAVLLLVNLV